MDEKDKKDYELAVLVAAEEDLAPLAVFVREHNAEIVTEPRAKRLALAYEIKKHKEAIFAYCTFKALPADAKTLEQDLNSKTEIIRFMVLASPPAAAGADRQFASEGADGSVPMRRTRIMRPNAGAPDVKPSAPKPLSNEALEKKIEEILQ